MNQNTTIQKLIENQLQLTQEVGKLKSSIDDLVRLLGPLYPRENFRVPENEDIVSSSDQGMYLNYIFYFIRINIYFK